MIIKNKGLCTGVCLGQARCQLSQSVAAPRPPTARESSPRTPQRYPRTRDRLWSLSSPTRSLHAYNDDATLSILATTTLKITIHLLSY